MCAAPSRPRGMMPMREGCSSLQEYGMPECSVGSKMTLPSTKTMWLRVMAKSCFREAVASGISMLYSISPLGLATW
jgi:hypothetical protein